MRSLHGMRMCILFGHHSHFNFYLLFSTCHFSAKQSPIGIDSFVVVWNDFSKKKRSTGISTYQKLPPITMITCCYPACISGELVSISDREPFVLNANNFYTAAGRYQ